MSLKTITSTTWTTRCNDVVLVELDRIGTADDPEFMVNIAVDAPIHLDEVKHLIQDLQDALDAAQINAPRTRV